MPVVCYFCSRCASALLLCASCAFGLLLWGCPVRGLLCPLLSLPVLWAVYRHACSFLVIMPRSALPALVRFHLHIRQPESQTRFSSRATLLAPLWMRDLVMYRSTELRLFFPLSSEQITYFWPWYKCCHTVIFLLCNQPYTSSNVTRPRLFGWRLIVSSVGAHILYRVKAYAGRTCALA